MNRIFLIARRDYIAAVFTKGFVIGLILAPLMMCGGLLALPVMKRVTPVERRLLIVDRSESLERTLADAAKARNQPTPDKPVAGPAIVLAFEPPSTNDLEAQRLRLADRVRSGALHAFVEIGPSVLHPTTNAPESSIRYYARSSALDETRGWLERTINEELRRRRFLAAGVDPGRLPELNAWIGVQGMTLPSQDRETGTVKAATRENEFTTIAMPMIVILTMMMLVMIGAMPLLQSVLEEKSQRIAEVLLGCASPWEIMAGKLLGSVCVTLTAMLFYFGAGATAAASMASSGLIPFHLLPWYAAFAISAVLMYGSVAVGLGAACSDAKDAQHLQMPVMIPIMLPVMLMMPVLKEPNSTFATAMSLVPPFTPLFMVLRMSSAAGVPAWQPWLGLLGMLATTAFTLWMAGRIFRVGILMQGKMPKFREILRWGLRG